MKAAKKRLVAWAMSMMIFPTTAQTAAASDTVSVAYMRDGAEVYMSVNGNVVTAVKTPENEAALWRRAGIGDHASRWQNILTGKWLRVSKNGSQAVLSLTDSVKSSVMHQPSATVSPSVRVDGTNYYLCAADNGLWQLQDQPCGAMRMEQWSRRHSVETALSVSQPAVVFPWASTDEEAREQAMTLRYWARVTDSTYYYRVADGRRLRPVVHVVTDGDMLHKAYGIEPKTVWQSPESPYSAASTLRGSAPAADAYGWTLVLTPHGKSPTDVKQNGKYVDLADTLWLHLTIGGIEQASASTHVVRKAYHYSNDNQLIANIEIENSMFGSTDNLTKHITPALTLLTGRRLYDADQTLVGGDTQTHELSLGDLGTPKAVVVDDDGKAVDWLQVAMDTDNNSLIAKAIPNMNTASRTAQIMLSDGAKDVASVAVTQEAKASTIVAKFIHQAGVGNRMMGIEVGEDEIQPVYTAERTIYYHPGEWLWLQSQSPTFYGYQRWYDYETGKDPVFPRIEGDAEDATTWANFPYGGYNAPMKGAPFRYINTDFENSKGVFAVQGDGLNSPDKYGTYAPHLTAWNSDTVRRTVACDFSMYRDYEVKYDNGTTKTDNNNLVSVKEPTLSYRQLFHLRPAADMAKQLAECTESNGGKYLEEYHYIAPVGTPIYIRTEYAHCYVTQHETEYGYYFYGTDGKLWRVSYDATSHCRPYAHVQWYQDGEQMTPQYINAASDNGFNFGMHFHKYDYVQVSSNTPGTITYTVRIPMYQDAQYEHNGACEYGKQVLDEDILLARFVVEYKDKSECGPATTLNSDTDFDDHFDLLKLQDFNYDKPGTSEVRFYDKPRAWDKSSYAFCYTNKSGLKWSRNWAQTMKGNSFPSFNEFSIVNKVLPDGKLNWVYEQEQRGGAENGYCLYVDGGVYPGLVATVDIDTSLCAQQKVYCSLWVCDATPLSQKQYTKPVIVCKVQGRHSSGKDTAWHDVETFNSGELPHDEAGWKHIFFPVESNDNYDEVRLHIYNFGTGTAANDFLIDDVALYATKNPLAAYQALTTCSNDDRDVAVIRIDYTGLPESWAHSEVYYQVFNTTDKTAVKTDYLHHKDSEYGSIIIPCKEYDPMDGNKEGHPLADDESKMVYTSLNDFVNSLYTYSENAILKGYVKHAGEDHYTMYVGHVFVGSDETGTTLNPAKTYQIRMARGVDDLNDDLCSYQTPLPIYDRTNIVINDANDVEQNGIVCPNALYKMSVNVSKSVTSGTVVTKVSAPALSDWLAAFDFDDAYIETGATRSSMTKEEADRLFANKYGYSRGDVTDAIHDMRRLPEPEQPNANYAITNINELKRSAFDRTANYDIIVSLYRKGLLRLAESSHSLYLTSEETARYWVFPIAGEVTTTHEDATITLEVCNEPIYAAISATASDQLLVLGPVQHGSLTAEQRDHVQSVRVREQEANSLFSVPIGTITNAAISTENCQVVLANDPSMTGKTVTFTPALSSDNTLLTFTPATSYTMHAGFEYTVRVGMTALSGDDAASDEGDDLPVTLPQSCEGNAYFTILVLPDTVEWAPSISNEWGEDSNWRAVIGGKRQSWGYAPLRTMVAIIPKQTDNALYPVVTTNNSKPLDANYTPQSCGALRLRSGAKLQNQHLLAYDSVFIDMPLKSARWYSMSAPLQGMVSGDFFIPYDAEGNNIESDNDFIVSAFSGNRKGTGAYAFWLSYYNRSVTMLNENPYSDRDSVSTNIEVFAKSNSLGEVLAPGQGFQVLGYGPGYDGENLVVRLPKPDNTYYYFHPDGSQSDRHEVLYRNRAGRLAYPATDGDGTMTITLTNARESRNFLFGNPTMAYIDMQEFFADNDNIESSFRYIDGSSWKTVTPSTATTVAERFVAPMQSVLLTAKTAAASLTLTLRDTHLTTSNTDASTTANSAPRRIQGVPQLPQTVDNEVMNITASNGAAEAFAALAIQDNASNGYISGEDVPFAVSGIGKGYVNPSAATTPLNIYTLAGTQALMADVREGISIVPLGFVISDEMYGGEYLYRTDSLTLSFRLTPNWSDDCYLCDARTGIRTLIGNDTEIRIATPADHELRYYIQGSFREPEKPDTPTDNHDIHTSWSAKPFVAISDKPETVTLIAAEDMLTIRAYDLTGRVLLHMHSDAPHSLGALTSVQLPSGIAIIEVSLASGISTQTKVIVQ